MLPARNLHHTDVLLKWLIMLATAALAALAVADRATGAEPAPRLLPAAMADWSRAMIPKQLTKAPDSKVKNINFKSQTGYGTFKSPAEMGG